MRPGIDDFNQLNPVVIIIIAPFDLFGKGKYRYTFSMQCVEKRQISLEDGAVRIFLNTHGTDDDNISQELKELLYFMEHTNDTDTEFHSDRVIAIRESVQTIQNNEEVGVRYMQAWEEKLMDRREGKEEGLREGREEGLREGRETGLREGRETGLREGEQRIYEEKIKAFSNLLRRGFSMEDAKAVLECGDDIAEAAAENLNQKYNRVGGDD